MYANTHNRILSHRHNNVLKTIEVFKAKERKNSSKYVAIKKIRMDSEKEGFPITALREINILKALENLENENIVKLLEICYSKSSIGKFFLIFEFCEYDLGRLLANKEVKFNLSEIKGVVKQMLNGIFHIHLNNILHRDLKPANILITKTGILKLADFGLARAFSIKPTGAKNRYTNRVITLWYRPPELLLGESNYGPSVDLWSAGCIMAEMWTRYPLLQGNSEQHQLNCISKVCGSITPEVWPGVENLELYKCMELPKGNKRKVREYLEQFAKCPDTYYTLLDQLLTLDPSKCINAHNALYHEFFWSPPFPTDLSRILAQHSRSMFKSLAPQRRQGQHPHHHLMATTSSSSKPLAYNGYQDRIF